MLGTLHEYFFFGVMPIFAHVELQFTRYTKKVIYFGTQNNVLLPIYVTTIIDIQNKNKVVELFGGGALHHATCLEDVPISYDQSLLKEIVAKH